MLGCPGLGYESFISRYQRELLEAYLPTTEVPSRITLSVIGNPDQPLKEGLAGSDGGPFSAFSTISAVAS